MQPSSTKQTPIVLAIAGSDSSGGAGIAADLKTGAAFGVFVCTAITAITAQNAFKVTAIECVDANLLKAQIQAVCAAHPPHAIKLGMLGNEANVRVVADYIAQAGVPVVVDPVLGASSGSSLWQNTGAAECYREWLFPHTTLLTPNIDEAARLLGEPPASDYAQMEQQAMALRALGPKAVLLKGGHLTGESATDCLAEADATMPFTARRIQTPHTHGSGCTLASAIAAGLAQNLSIKQAMAAAKTYINGGLSHAERLNLVAANGPLHHFYSYW